MPTSFRRMHWSFLKSMGLILVLAGCVTTEVKKPESPESHVPTLLTDKTADQLKQELADTLKGANFWVRQHHMGHSMLTYENVESITAGTDEFVVKFAHAQVYGNGPTTGIFDYQFTYSDLAAMHYDSDTCREKLIVLPDGMDARFPNPIGYRLCDILFTLASLNRGKAAENDARFLEQVARYRDMAVKPPVTEDMRRLIVQAEMLRDRKDYTGAAERYRRALDIDPVAYPAAYFNLALLYEQQGLFTRAIDAMQKYLMLQPNAADARAAQDKIYGWEMLAGKK